MSYTPPDTSWMIQDLDMNMYPPQDRAPAFPIKTEVPMEPCAYATSGHRPQSCMVSPPNGYNVQYSEGGGYTGEWPADLDNIHIDCNLPTEAESPLKLEDYNMQKFVFVDPATQSPSPICSSHQYQSSECSPMKYSSPPSNMPPHAVTSHPAVYYDQTPVVTMETLQPEITPVASIPESQCQGRPMGRRGRPRTEWRINKRGPGRPRCKPGRKPTLGVVKTELELSDDEENMYPVMEEKRERRREQNRRAARKLRKKKKVPTATLR